MQHFGKVLQFVCTLPQVFLLCLIRFYKIFISPFLGHHCRFTPSCFNFAHHAILSLGVLHGLWVTSKRLLRCNPWCTGGFDPVPTKCNHKPAR